MVEAMTLLSQRQSLHQKPPSLRRRRPNVSTTSTTTTTNDDDTGKRAQRHNSNDATSSLLSSSWSRIWNVLISGVSSPPWMMIVITLVVMVVALAVMVVTTNHFPPFSHHHRNHSVSIMLQSFCDHHQNTRATTTKCHFSLGLDRPDGRRVTAQINSIPAYQTVLRISKHDTIWDIDAIQDPWIQQQQQQQQRMHHSGTATGLSADAYLSLYLARRLFHPPPQSHHTTTTQAQDQKYELYFATLPRHVHEFHDHPIFWSTQDLSRRLGTFTVAYHSVRQLQHMIQWEYDSFLPSMTATKTPSSNIDMPIIISYDQYRIARVNVLSRSFGTGPIPLASDAELRERLMNVQSYAPHLNFTNGHHVMVPILDQLNHHGQDYNVDFTYDLRNQSFVVRSNTMIPVGHEIMDHYGKHTSSHLFAKYGFINYDSSDYNEATIALWHNLPVPYQGDHHSNNNDAVVPEERKYRLQMLRYLQYDDGYHTCIGDPLQLKVNDSNMPQQPFLAAAWKLKQLKYKILLTMAGRRSSHWVIQMSPAKSPRSTTTNRGGPPQPPHIKSEQQVQQLLSTCRLLVLRHDDFKGTATDILSQIYNEQSFHLSSPFLHHNDDAKEENMMTMGQHDDDDDNKSNQNSHALEFRTYMCLARMVQTAMMRFPRSTVSKQWEYIAETLEPLRSSMDDDDDQTNNEHVTSSWRRNWTIAHLHYSELLALETLKQIVFSHLRQHYSDWMSTVVPNTDRDMIQSHNDTTILYTMRDEPCTFQQYLQPLLNL